MAKKRLMLPLIIVIGIAGITLAVLGKWSWLLWGILLLCPLIHLFGHNHGGHSHGEQNHGGGHNQSNGSKHHH